MCFESAIVTLSMSVFSGFSLTEVQKKQAMLNACKSHPAGKPKGTSAQMTQRLKLHGSSLTHWSVSNNNERREKGKQHCLNVVHLFGQKYKSGGAEYHLF